MVNYYHLNKNNYSSFGVVGAWQFNRSPENGYNRHFTEHVI